jgi:hypothetical protein
LYLVIVPVNADVYANYLNKWIAYFKNTGIIQVLNAWHGMAWME